MSQAINSVKKLAIAFDTTLSVRTYLTNLEMGAGIAYTLEEGKYWETPLALIFPSIYIGYKIYDKRNAIKNFMKNN